MGCTQSTKTETVTSVHAKDKPQPEEKKSNRVDQDPNYQKDQKDVNETPTKNMHKLEEIKSGPDQLSPNTAPESNKDEKEAFGPVQSQSALETRTDEKNAKDADDSYDAKLLRRSATIQINEEGHPLYAQVDLIWAGYEKEEDESITAD